MKGGRPWSFRRRLVISAAVIAGGGLWFAAADPPSGIKVETIPPPARSQPVQAQVSTEKPAKTKPATTESATAEVATTDSRPAPESPARERLRSGLIGSKHDFTQGGEAGRDLCLPCHTPHVAISPAPRLDLRPSTTQPLRPFQKDGIELDGWSLLCLGCHDGTTAPDVYSTSHAVTVADQLGNSRLGIAGLRSHPVGIMYPEHESDFQPLAAVEQAGLPLPNGRIQCGTCHDAHNTFGYEGMLKTSNERSRLCLACHRR